MAGSDDSLVSLARTKLQHSTWRQRVPGNDQKSRRLRKARPMNAQPSPDPPIRRFSFVERFLLWPTMVRLEILECSPEGDIKIAKAFGTLQWLTCLWTVVLLVNLLRVMFSHV
jgi:hypothetical protein